MNACSRSKFAVGTLVFSLGMLPAWLQAQQSSPSGDAGQAELYRHSLGDGTDVFAVAVQPARVPETATRRNHVVLVDTSASQVGEHRQQAFAVLTAFLDQLPQDHRVALYAVDVKSEPLSEGFVAPAGAAAEQALDVLNQRIPLGATNLLTAVQTAQQSIDADQLGSVLYIGDGMSTANLLQSSELSALLAGLREQRIPVHSYAVGPKTDLQLLGVVAQQTGGVVLFDRADEKRDAAEVAAQKLVAAVGAPVFYPSQISADEQLGRFLPHIALPLRTDRATVYLAKGNLQDSARVSLTGTVVGREESLSWTVAADRALEGYPMLGALWQRAEKDDGLSVPLAGRAMIHVAQDAFEDRVNGLVGLGEQALAIRSLRQAEQFAVAVQQLDPDNPRGKELLRRVDQLEVRTVAQVQPPQPPQPPQPGAGQQPNAQPPNVQQPGGGLLDGPLPPEVEAGAAPPAALRSDIILTQEERMQLRTESTALTVERDLEEARVLAQEDPTASLSELKRLLGFVVSAGDIYPEAQQQLTKKVRMAIQDVQSRQFKVDLERVRAAEREAQLEAEQRLIEQLLLEDEELEMLIDRVRGLLVEGRHGDDAAFEQAEEVAETAVDLRPAAGISEQARFVSEAAGALNQAFRLRALRRDRFLETLYQVELSHVPFPDEPPIRWPPAPVWQQLTQTRKKWASVDLHKNSPAEERIQAALREETETGFIDTALKDAIDFLEELHGITIIIDEAGLVEEGIASDEPINLDINGITLRSALRIMLEPLGLTYIIEDEVMKITTQIKAEDSLQTRVYPVGDLVIPISSGGMMGGGMMGGMMGGMGGGMMGGMGGGMGGMGGGMGGMGGGFGGGGFFSIPPERIPQAGNRPVRRVRDVEVRSILDRIGDRKTSATELPRGQYFAQVVDPMPESSDVFDNAAIEALKKKLETTAK